MPFLMPSLKMLGVGHENIVTDDLHRPAEAVGQQLPAVPVAFGHAVLDRDDRELVSQVGQVVGKLGRSQLQPFAGQMVFAVLVELGSGAVERQQDILARHVTGFFDRLHDDLERFGMAAEVRRKAAFVADGCRVAILVEQLLQRVENLGTAAQGFAEAGSADRHDHEFLDIEAVVGVLATVDDVHHRHRHLHRAHATKITVERQAGFLGSRLGHGHRHGQHGIGAETRLVVGTVEIDHGLVDEGLFLRIEADDGFGNLGIDVLDCLQDALAEVTAGVAVTQFDGFARTGGSTGRHGGAAHDAAFQQHVCFDRGIAAGIENLSGDDIND